MKKTFCILICVCVFALCMASASAETLSGACGDNVKYTLDTDTGVLTISGAGTMWDFSSAPWCEDLSLVKEVIIEENDNFEDVHDKLGALSATLLTETLAALKEGRLVPIPQSEEGACYAAKIENADCILDFSRSAREVHNRIRGLSPIPLSLTHTPDGRLLKIIESRLCHIDTRGALPGTVLSLDGGRITVACGKEAVALLTVLPEGKKRMSAADFINGRRIAVGDVLG